ncbi:MAG TPA: endonuclease/exonuclease/phosphatase family protein [Conexibacter sp.]|nr:endonuclease/exonuclease/phosphatase family protein [Conexibacter sp.]
MTVRGAIALAVAAPWALWTVVRVLGIEDGHPLLPAMAFTPYVAATAWVPVLLALVLRRWAVAALAGLAMAALTLTVAPRALHSPQEPLPGGTPLSVMSANLLRGHGSATAVMSLARRRHVDVLSLQELTPDAILRLDRAGARDRFPYRVLDARAGVHGSGLMSRYPLLDAHKPSSSLAMPDAQLAVPGVDGTVFVKAIHVVTPLHDEIPVWRDELRALPPATPDGRLRLLIGDFNATLDHHELRALIATGYRDAADATGNGLHGTYRNGRLPLTIAIDHVLVDRRAHITAASIHPIPGSDHRALLATVSLPSARR